MLPIIASQQGAISSIAETSGYIELIFLPSFFSGIIDADWRACTGKKSDIVGPRHSTSPLINSIPETTEADEVPELTIPFFHQYHAGNGHRSYQTAGMPWLKE